MEKLGINWKILLGQIINFVILLFLLKRFAFKPLFKILSQRKTKIEEGVKKSAEAESGLAKIRLMYDELQTKGEKEARALLARTAEESGRRAKEILSQAEEAKKKILESGRASLEGEIERGRADQEKKAVDLAILLSEKFLKEKINENKDRKIIEELMHE